MPERARKEEESLRQEAGVAVEAEILPRSFSALADGAEVARVDGRRHHGGLDVPLEDPRLRLLLEEPCRRRRP